MWNLSLLVRIGELKIMGNLSTDFISGGSKFGILNGIGGVIRLPAGWTSAKIAVGQFRVTFDTPMSTGDYIVVATANRTSFVNVTTSAKLVGSFDLFIKDETAAALDSEVQFTFTE